MSIRKSSQPRRRENKHTVFQWFHVCNLHLQRGVMQTIVYSKYLSVSNWLSDCPPTYFPYFPLSTRADHIWKMLDYTIIGVSHSDVNECILQIIHYWRHAKAARQLFFFASSQLKEMTKKNKQNYRLQKNDSKNAWKNISRWMWTAFWGTSAGGKDVKWGTGNTLKRKIKTILDFGFRTQDPRGSYPPRPHHSRSSNQLCLIQ